MRDVTEIIDLELKPGFLEAGTICDYEVSEKAKRIWAVQLDLLDRLLKVCAKHDIKVAVFAGTLLGAIRHHGFIPWDDDIDVCLTRENYEKLVRVAPEEFGGRYFFQTALSDRKYFIGYARLRNSETTGVIKWNASPDYNNGIYIDIFPLDGYTPSGVKLELQLALRALAKKMCSVYCASAAEERGVRRFVTALLHATLFRLTSYEFWVRRYDRVLTMYSGEPRVTMLTHSKAFLKKYWCDKRDLEDLETREFEGIAVPVPKNYDGVLRHLYGDYMRFPPIEKRGVWHGDSLVLDPDVPYKAYLAGKTHCEGR